MYRPAEEVGREGAGRQVRWYDVSPNYFETLGIPLLRGRNLNLSDGPESTQVAMVNETLADLLWPDQDPIGRRVWLEGLDQIREVVGVVADVPLLDPDAAVGPEIFWPQAQYTRPFTWFILRTEGDPSAIRGQVEGRIKGVDPKLQVGLVRSYEDLVSRRLVQPRFNMLLVGIFSAVALILAGVGIFGVVSRSVAARTREIGIRMALGAPASRVVGGIVRGSLVLAGMGVSLGLVLALVLSRFIRSLLHGVEATDPLTYVLVALTLFGVALMASLVPASRASRVSPMASLREE